MADWTARARIPGVLAGIALGLMACSRGNPDRDNPAPNPSASALPEPAASTAATAAPSTPPPVASVTIKLIDPGAEPRRELRYKFQVGRPDTVIMDMKIAVAMELGGQKQPENEAPPIRMAITIAPEAVTPEGDLRYQFRLTSAEVLKDKNTQPTMAQALEAQLKPAVGMSGFAVVSSRGITKDAEFNAPAGVGPQVQQLLENLRGSVRNLASPMPEEAVGKGAKWEVVVPLDTPALKLMQTSTHTLRDLNGDKGTVDIALRQEAPAQRMTLPSQRGTTTTLESFGSTGSGTLEFDLHRLVPQSSVKLTSTMNSRVTSGGQSQPMMMTMRVQMTTHPKVQ